MQSLKNRIRQSTAGLLGACLLGASAVAFAQDQSAPPPPPPDTQDQSQAGANGSNPYPPSPSINNGRVQATDPNAGAAPQNGSGNWQPFGQSPYGNQPNGQQPAYGQYGQQNGQYGSQMQAPPPIPAQLNITSGTYVTVRVNQALSSDRNRSGDTFTATLVDPLVVNGIVVAEPGQTLGGRVTEAVKAGRIEGTARLGVQLTDLTLADGQNVSIRTQFISQRAGSTVGRDAGAIAGTTAVGAAIGAAAGWGRGAAIGAGAGAAVSTLGVLLTRGNPSIIAPEQVLTFRIEVPVSFSTSNAPQAFHYIQQGEYDRPNYAGSNPGFNNGPSPYPPTVAQPPIYYGAPAPYYAYGYGYPYPYYGPSVGIWVGRPYYHGYYGHPYSYGGRYYGRR